MGFFSIFKKKKDKEINSEEQVLTPENIDEKQPEEAADQPDFQQKAELEAPKQPEEESEAEKQDYAEKPAEKPGFFKRLKQGLSKTSGKLVGGMETIFSGKKVIDEDLLEELEELFITSDVGVSTTMKIIDNVRDELSRKALKNPQELKASLRKQILNILDIPNELNTTDDKPYVILVAGVNGAGKTTSIAKMAKRFKEQGLSTCLAAGDTFRAAAIDQLCVWAKRVDVPVVKQSEGSDSAAVIFDAIQSCKSKKIDVLIADTAGRLHNKFNLMKEMEKIVRIAKRELPDAPHEVLLVLDATSGQNALSQAQKFHEDIGITGLVLTKLDGTAKGGAVIGIVDELQIPVKFIGFGEGIDDMKPFSAEDFVNALFDNEFETEN
ncbi:signal recognition particle-docking protein FtsY [Denitrovibrio acetiphilus DSM 12809]|uniref:Signal recognition particle receptor FtsY n=1 Tax=Denitrovibrio acetiphilus (strain DSM 12809 / NBRC 114555 / N2460) TaxID=522772 RepID=D4H2W5_DENA2|nr:signal recognition particle-docking protein FtsY [Denitrovibrio acetiphilus]ADD68988.1 signal recognition particle-docking protein FtsY [Denitrovibrio acetiphilus DSM 12809]